MQSRRGLALRWFALAASAVATIAVARTSMAAPTGASGRTSTSERPADRPRKGHARRPRDGHRRSARSDRGALRRRDDDRSAKPSKKRAAKRCLRPATTIARPELRESSKVSLTDCQGRPLLEAQETLSVLARRRGTRRPSRRDIAKATGAGDRISDGTALLDPGLLSRLEAIAGHFGRKPIEIVSGYRPQSDGSNHQRARALDVRVRGISNEELVAFCRTLDDTGCGYYPNSSFVHVDVREKGSGHVTWIDASGPGEAPRYVTSWPPRAATESDETAPSGEAHESTGDAER